MTICYACSIGRCDLHNNPTKPAEGWGAKSEPCTCDGKHTCGK